MLHNIVFQKAPPAKEIQHRAAVSQWQQKKDRSFRTSFLLGYIKIDSKFGAFERSNRICASSNTYSMCSMIVEKKLMQKHPAGIIITTNMHANNTCCVQYSVLAPKPQYKYDRNNK